MSNIKIQDVDQRIQYTATASQTEFTVPFPFFENSDLVVYQNSTLLTITTEYTVTGAGSASGGLVTLVTGATVDDIITIYGNMPIDRTSIYSATISNLTGSDLNNDFNRDIVIAKQLETTQVLLQLQYQPYAEVSQDDSVTLDRWLPVLGANQGWAKNAGNTAIVAYDLPEGGAAPKDAKYLIQTADSDLPNAQDMGSLASGVVVNTTSTGVQLTRVITGTADEITLANGDGIAANPTISIADNPVLPGTGGVTVPDGTTAQRAGAAGTIRFNTDTTAFEGTADGATWDTFPGAGSTVNSVTGTTNQVDVDNSDPTAPVIGLSSTINCPGTFTIQGTIALDAIIDDDTFATATDTNIPTAESVKAYVDSGGGAAFLPLAGGTMAGDINMDGNNITNIGYARFVNGSNYVGFIAPTLATDTQYTLPPTYPGTSGYILASTDAGVMSWVANTAGSMVSVIGTANEIDVDATDPQNPILSLSATLDAPGTFTIQGTVALDAVIDDDTFATASATNIPTAESVKAYVDATAGSSTGVTLDVNQAGHGFSVNDVIRLSGTSTYTKAQADSAANAEAIGIVVAVADTDNFTVQQAGHATSLGTLTANTVYFLSEATAGLLTATEPSGVGEISKPILVTDTTTSGWVIPYRGNEILASTPPAAQYDIAMNAGFDTAGAATDIVAQPYSQSVMARSGSFTGEAGYIDTAPTGQAAIVDVLKNGTTIYTTKPQFAAGANTLTAGTLKTDGTEDFVSGDRITISVTQIGSGTAGAGLRFTVTGEV